MTLNVNSTQDKFFYTYKSFVSLLAFRNVITILLLSLCSQNLISQNDFYCGQTQAINNWFSKNPELRKKYEEQQASALQHSNNNSSRSRQTNYTIPLVFHVLHVEGVENISNEQIFDQVAILNRDYNKLNADTALIDAPFKNNIANIDFSFKLASIDPNGNCTNGIVRHYDARTLNWDTNNLNDFTYSWPTNQYLNVYIVRKLNINATAYAFLPGVGVPDFADVIVMTHDMCGSIGTGTVANSRVLTHEVAHWFDIQHTWGSTNAPGVACGDDLINDTPITKGFSNCNIANSNVCDAAIYENIQNYMDYSPCKIMFTNGQKDRMYATIASGINGRDDVFSEANLIATGVIGTESCNTNAAFYTTRKTSCVGESFTFNSLSQFGSAAGNRSLLWNFPGGTPTSSTDSIVTVEYFNEGIYPVTLTATGPNGTDLETKSDFIKIVKPTGVTLPYTCDFENSVLPSSLEIINQQQDSIYWKHITGYGANNSSGSIFLNNFSDTTNYGNRDYFETPVFDFSNTTGASLSFYYAYAKRYPNQADSFWVQYSTDCGGTWTRLTLIPNTNGMANNSGGTLSTEFVPDNTQWKKVVRQLPLDNKENVKFRFFFKSDFYVNGSNNIFLDEINIDGNVLTTDVQDMTRFDLSVYPNPVDNHLTIEFIPKEDSVIEIILSNILGQQVNNILLFTKPNTLIKHQIDVKNKFPEGTYFLTIKTKNDTYTKRVLISQ